MSATTCQRCGAGVRGLVCEYCGVLHHAPTSTAEEKEAWIEFLGILQTKEPKTQIILLQNGFLPDSLPTLIDAGLHCVGLVDVNNTGDSLAQTAYQRLQAITAKLKILPATPESERAVTQFEEAITTYGHANRRFNRFLFGGLLALLSLCAALVGGFVLWLGGSIG